MRLFLLLLTLCSCYSEIYALYFHIRETESKCFVEEVPEDTLVAGLFRVEEEHNGVFAPASSLGLIIEIIDPDAQLIHSKLYSSEGRFTFTAHSPGDYRICLSSNSSAWFGGELLRVYLDIGIGDHAQNYAEIASKEKLTDLQLRVRQLIDKVEMITKDQNFQRVREEHFRSLSESTNRRVTWWSVGQFVLLIAMGFWQMRHLRSFFQAKKLV